MSPEEWFTAVNTKARLLGEQEQLAALLCLARTIREQAPSAVTFVLGESDQGDWYWVDAAYDEEGNEIWGDADDEGYPSCMSTNRTYEWAGPWATPLVGGAYEINIQSVLDHITVQEVP